MSQRKTVKAGEFLLIIGILMFLVLVFWVNVFHFNFKMNADIASDVVLAKLIWTRKEIIPSTWYRANETRVICTPNFAALFYGLTKNMVLSEGMACCLMTLMILVGILYFGKKAELKKSEMALFVLLGLALPVNMAILELLYLFASYYAIHVVILFFTLGVYVERISKKEFSWISAGLSIVCAFCLGIQGVRGILVLYGPLFGIEVLRIVYCIYCRVKNEKVDWLCSIWAFSLLVVSFIGTCFPFSTGQGFSRNIRSGLKKLFTVVFPNIKRAIGFENANIYGRLFLGILLIAILYILGSVVCCIWKKRSIDAISWAFLVICASPVVTALMIAFTTVDDSERYYFLLIYAMAFAAVLVWQRIGSIWKVAGGILIAMFMMVSIHTVYLPVILSEEPLATEEYAVGKYLEENDYQIAYATFENANTITVLTNGRVQVSSVASVDKMDICKWMTSTEWYVPNMPFEERTAYIITESEAELFESFREAHKDEMEFVQKIGKYLIYTSDYNFSMIG